MAVTEPTAADWIEVLVRRRIAAGCAAAVGALLAWVVLGRTPPLYEAEAVLVLDRGGKGDAIDSRAMEVDPFVGSYEEKLVATERELLVSAGGMRKAVAGAGLESYDPYAGSRDPAAILARRTSAKTAREGWSITLTVRDEDPQRAEAAAAALIAAYEGEQADRAERRNREQIAAFEQQAVESERRLLLARTAERDFAQANGVVTTDLTDQNPLVLRLRDLNAERIRLEPQAAAAASAARMVAEADAAGAARHDRLLAVPEIGADGSVFNSRDALARYETEAATLAVQLGERHPRMIAAREKVASERANLAAQIERARSAVLAERDRRADQLARLNAQVADDEARLARYRDALVKLRLLTDDAVAAGEVHRKVLERLREQQVRRNLHRAPLTVSQQPVAGGQAVTGQRSVNAAISLFAGLVAGVSLPLLLELLTRRVIGSDAVQRLSGLRTLAAVPTDPRLGEGAPGEAFHESIRALRAALALARPEGHACGYALVVSSPAAHDGKTTIALHLARSLASSGARTLLVDADLHRAALTARLVAPSTADQPAPHGLAQLLAGVGEVAAVDAAGIAFMPAGGRTASAGELLNSHCLPEWLAESRQEYDWIVIDAPPVGVVADAVMLLAAADGLVLVVRDGATDRRLLASAMQRLEPLRPRLLGAVLNAAPVPGGYAY